MNAPDKATADKVHAEAHGHVANEMIAVDLSAVEAFLGRVRDPPSAKTTPIDGSAFGAIMFTDMVGSTEMTAQFGDRLAVELIKTHDAIIRRCLEYHDGSEVKHLGDGIMAPFADAPASVACAIKIQDELASYNRNSEIPIRVRIGIHAGEPVKESRDFFSVRQCKWRLESVISRRRRPFLCPVRSGMRVLPSILVLNQRVLKL